MSSFSLRHHRINLSKVKLVVFLFSTLFCIVSYTSYLAIWQQFQEVLGNYDEESNYLGEYDFHTKKSDNLDDGVNYVKSARPFRNHIMTYLRNNSFSDLGNAKEGVLSIRNNGFIDTIGVSDTITEEKIKDKKDSFDWVISADCMKPLTKMIGAGIIDSEIPSRILNVGMPKSGTTSLYHFFRNSGIKFKNSYANSSHHLCQGNFPNFGPWHPINVYCGHCIKIAIQRNLDPLLTCGDHVVWTQLDVEDFGCYFPQISAIELLYRESTTAVLLLPFRNFDDWLRSVDNWNNLRERLTKCNIDGLPTGKGDSDDGLKAFVCNHVKNIRRFVLSHPTLTLIEFNLDDKSGEYLSNILPGLEKSFWDIHNANNGVEQNETIKHISG